MTNQETKRYLQSVADRGAARRGFLYGLCVIVPLLGCESSNEPPPPTDPSMLRGIVRIYGIAARDLGRPPQSMEELKAVLAPVTDDPAKYLRSTRDGKEFVVVWGQQMEGALPDTVLAYERTGVDGKRIVVTADGTVNEYSADEFAKLRFPKHHKPDI